MHATFTAELTAETGRRLVTGLVLPFDKYGMTSAGKVKVRRDAKINLPADLSRIKLIDRHTDDARAAAEVVGAGVSAQFTDNGLEITFKVVAGERGDRVLAEAADKTNDGLSVELTRVLTHGDEVLGGDVSAVAQVPIPAWDDARITDVAAQSHDATLTAQTDPHGHDGHQPTGGHMTITPTEPTTPAEPNVPAEPTTPAEPSVPAEPNTSDDGLTAAAQVPAIHASGSPTPRRRNGSDTTEALFQAVALHGQGHRSPELTAALADITYSAGPFADQPEYVGELWSGVAYQRRFVPLLTQRTLTSLKLKGWKWVDPPTVAAYAGDKAAIPSNTIDLEAVEATATRLAGGHDIDRAYYDFGDREFIESYYRALVESYAKTSDLLAEAAIIAAAATSATTGTDLLEAVAIGVDEVETATGAQANFVLVNRADRRALLSLTTGDVPAYLREILKVDPANFVVGPNVPAGNVVVGTKEAMTHAELPGSPIRVTAVNVPNGGVDEAVFGYRAILLNDAAGLSQVTFS